jgi:parallel beta-helix repeat protein
LTEVNKNAVNVHENSKKIIIKDDSNLDRIYDNDQLMNILSRTFSSMTNLKEVQVEREPMNLIFDIKLEQSEIIEKNDGDIYVDDDNVEGPWDGTFEHPYRFIQDAINNSNNSDVIFVFDGIYYEKLIINKSISLIGNDNQNTIICGTYDDNIGSDKDTVITITANFVNIAGFNITTRGGYPVQVVNFRTCNGILLDKSSNCNIFSNNLNKLGHRGIRLIQSHNNCIERNLIYNVYNKWGTQIVLDSSNNNIIKENFLSYSAVYTIWISRGENNKVLENVIEKSLFGIVLKSANSTEILKNTFKEIKNQDIRIEESNRNSIVLNNFMKFKGRWKYKLKHRPAVFKNSYDNIWTNNYWGRTRILPVRILGKIGEGTYRTTFDFDRSPAKIPYDS